MQIRLASPLQRDSVVDGYGIRTVIWTQGCSHNCPFCHNPSTHDFNKGELIDIEDIKEELDNLLGQDGITFSGGDPLYQVEAVLEIAKYAKKLNLNVWCYTGFTYEEILKLGENNKNYLEVLKYIDVLVDGRFEIDKKNLDLLFRGSSNQRLIDLKKTIHSKKVVLLDESDGIIEKHKRKEVLYI